MEYLTDALFMCDLFADTADVKAVRLTATIVHAHTAVIEDKVVRIC